MSATTTRGGRLSLSQARRIALAAQGLDRPRRDGPVTMRGVQRVVDRLGIVQIDSVNVLARAHLMPMYSRLGPYDPALLDRASGKHPRRLVESWAHEASLVPPETYRLLTYRRTAQAVKWYAAEAGLLREHAAEVAEIRKIVADEGPVTASQVQERFESRHPRTGAGWWEWSVAKQILERLFFLGEIASAGRTASFERRYDLPERVLPREVLEAPAPSADDAVRALVELAARAHGVGSLRCLADYYRIKTQTARSAVLELVEEGVLAPVEVSSWNTTVYVHRDAARPRRASGRALLSPFDPLVWERRRLLALFGMHYRIEIYTPADRRRYGYYTLPFLVGEHVAGRVDLKADRAARRLLVPAAWAEDHAPEHTAAELAAELALLARWLDLDEVHVADRGELARPLRAELAAAGELALVGAG